MRGFVRVGTGSAWPADDVYTSQNARSSAGLRVSQRGNAMWILP